VLTVFACTGNTTQTTGNNQLTTGSSQTTITTPGVDETCVVDRTGINEADMITLEYASFENQEVERQMVCRYMQLNPTIEVILRSDILEMSGVADNFSNSLVALAAIGDVPDIFQVIQIDPLVQNLLVYDFAAEWAADPDTAHLMPGAVAPGLYGTKRLAMVNGQVMQGVFVNKDLLDDNNFNLEDYGFDFSEGEIWNYEEMIDLARDFTLRARARYNNDYYWGIDGDWNNLNFAWTLSAMDNPAWGLSAFDGTAFHFTDQVYIDHYQREIDLYQEGVKVDVRKDPAGAQLEFGNTNPDLFFTEGRVLLYSSYSWNFNQFNLSPQSLMFLPFPKGIATDAVPRTPSAVGILALAANTPHPQEAYDLAKFMSWGEEGNLEKIAIHQGLGERITKLPVTDFESVWDEIEAMFVDSESEFYIEGFDMIMYPLIETREVVMDFGKWLPGYGEFKNWYTYVQTESRRTDVANGIIRFADVAAVWEAKANELVTTKIALYANYPNLSVE
jgi:multiple sugar transport system substrate-binding protein